MTPYHLMRVVALLAESLGIVVGVVVFVALGVQAGLDRLRRRDPLNDRRRRALVALGELVAPSADRDAGEVVPVGSVIRTERSGATPARRPAERPAATGQNGA